MINPAHIAYGNLDAIEATLKNSGVNDTINVDALKVSYPAL
jgi:hypothetical protein